MALLILHVLKFFRKKYIFTYVVQGSKKENARKTKLVSNISPASYPHPHSQASLDAEKVDWKSLSRCSL